MPRRPPNDLTPSDTGTPTDGSLTPTETVPVAPAALPKPPTLPRPPRLPPAGATPPAQPGRRSGTPSDLTMTSKIQRVPARDPTPAPLPPSPGARDAERWFEQVPTNPAAHLAAGAETTGSHRRAKAPTGSDADRETATIPPSWVLTGLIAAIALTIGMIVGALLFGHGSTKCEPCDKAPTIDHPKQ